MMGRRKVLSMVGLLRMVAVFAVLAFGAVPAFSQSTLTPNVGFQIPAYQQQNWQVPINFNFAKLDNLFGGSSGLPLGATPTVGGFTNYITANTSTTTITNFVGGFPGQRIQIFCGMSDTFTSIAASATINLTSTWSCGTSSSITLTLLGTVWQEVTRQGGGGGTPGGSPMQLQFNSTTFGGVAGSAVTPSTGAIGLTAGADTTIPFKINQHSATQTAPLFILNSGSSDNCVTSFPGFQFSACVYEGTTGSGGFYISGDGSALDSGPGVFIVDTQATTNTQPNAVIFWSQAGGLFLIANHNGGDDNAEVIVGYDPGNPNTHSGVIALSCGNSGGDPRVYFFDDMVAPAGPHASVNCATGEIAAGDVGVNANGFYSITDAPATHKISMKNPGTMSANYEWDYPITPGTAGQPLLSQGGAGTPMIWAASTFPPNILFTATVPTIGAAGCGGSGASISSNNGTASFRVGIGTSNTGTCTITMPAATTGWNCSATNLTTKNTNQFSVQETSASGVTTLVLQNYTDVMSTHAMTDADSLTVTCMAN